MGRKKSEGHRTSSGQLSRTKGARPDQDDGLVRAQPHRRPFASLLGDAAAGSWAASFALGRTRLIAEAEERTGRAAVLAFLMPDLPVSKAASMPSLGISERLFFAGMRYAQVVGRERWARAAPKDKPSAMAFMQARGISLNAHEITAEESARNIMEYEEAAAALMAAPCSRDMRSVVRTLRLQARARDAHEMVALLRGLGALMNPQASGAIKRAVETLVLDDRDVDPATLDLARTGLSVLADHFYGPDQPDSRKIRGSVLEKPLWLETDFKVIELSYRHYDGTPRRAGEPEKPEPRAGRGNWKGRHTSLR